MLRQDQPPAAGPTSSGSGHARPGWITPELVARTRVTWQPYYPQPLTDDDAIEMLLTVGNLYRVRAGDTDHDEQLQDHEDGRDHRPIAV